MNSAKNTSEKYSSEVFREQILMEVFVATGEVATYLADKRVR
jgi:hypothetical protein